MAKKGILYTMTIITMLFSLFLLANAYVNQTQRLEPELTTKITAELITYLENDLVGQVYNELLGIQLHSIQLTSGFLIKFNGTQLSPDRDHARIFQRYQSFVESNYTQAQGLELELIGFNHTFSIQPHDALVDINGTTMQIYTHWEDWVSVSVDVTVSADNDSLWSTAEPSDDVGGQPISVAYYDAEGDRIYEHSANLKSTIDNDDVLGHQFYASFQDGLNGSLGAIDIKYGQVGFVDGNFLIELTNISGNVTSLEIELIADPARMILEAGNISFKSAIGVMEKNTRVILGEQ